jgi:hypothetical protein
MVLMVLIVVIMMIVLIVLTGILSPVQHTILLLVCVLYEIYFEDFSDSVLHQYMEGTR